MSNFVKLSTDQVIHLYKVRPELAEDALNAFYGTSNMPNSGYDDGPWPLVTFLYSRELKNKVVVQVSMVEEELLEFNDFDPLTDPFCGYIYLNKSYLMALSRLLVEQSERTLSSEQDNRDNFEIIEQVKFDYYHLRPKNHPKKFRFHWRLNNIDNDSIIRLVTISCGKVLGPYVNPDNQLRFMLSFREFSKIELNDEQFTPLDEAPSRITLNRKELTELSSIIENSIDYYENNLP